MRREAVADALERGREYAAAVGARLDRIVEIADQGMSVGSAMMMRGAYAKGADVELDIDPQPQTVSASVQVRFVMTEPTVLADPPSAG